MKKSAVRERILDVASRLFYEQGYNLTGINQIIEEAGIARGSLYNHFDSKTDLLLAYLKEAEDNWFGEMTHFLSPIIDPQEKILALFDFRMARQLKLNFAGCQFIKISSEVPKDDAAVFKAVTHQKDRFRLFILDRLKERNMPNRLMPMEMLADTLYLLLEGAAVTGAIYKSSDALENARKIAGKLLSDT